METLEIKDLEGQAAQTSELHSKAERLVGDIQNRNQNLEINLKNLEQNQKAIPTLRDEYDGCLDKGEAQPAGDTLVKIKKTNETLMSLANNTRGSGSDIGDLNERQDSLRMDVLALIEIAEANLLRATELRNAAGLVLSIAGDSAAHSLQQIGRTIQKSKKLAEEILSAE